MPYTLSHRSKYLLELNSYLFIHTFVQICANISVCMYYMYSCMHLCVMCSHMAIQPYMVSIFGQVYLTIIHVVYVCPCDASPPRCLYSGLTGKWCGLM